MKNSSWVETYDKFTLQKCLLTFIMIFWLKNIAIDQDPHIGRRIKYLKVSTFIVLFSFEVILSLCFKLCILNFKRWLTSPIFFFRFETSFIKLEIIKIHKSATIIFRKNTLFNLLRKLYFYSLNLLWFFALLLSLLLRGMILQEKKYLLNYLINTEKMNFSTANTKILTNTPENISPILILLIFQINTKFCLLKKCQ